MASWDKVEKDVESGPGGLFKWILIAIIAFAIVGFGLKWAGIFGTTVAERAVFSNSYQKKSADNARIATLESQIDTARFNLSQAEDPDTQAKIRAQIQLLETQLDRAQRLAN